MKRITLTAIGLMALSITAWSCSGEKKADPHAGHDHAGMEHAGTAMKADTAGRDAYPLDYCIVTGQKFGSMGEPVTYVHEGRTLKFCCNGCVATFKKDPAKWLAKLDEAVASRKADPHGGNNH